MNRSDLVSWVRAAAVAGLMSIGVSGDAGVIDPQVDPKGGGAASPESFYTEVAARFAAVRQLSERLSTPESGRARSDRAPFRTHVAPPSPP